MSTVTHQQPTPNSARRVFIHAVPLPDPLYRIRRPKQVYIGLSRQVVRGPVSRFVVDDVEAVDADRAVMLEKRRQAKAFIPASREQPNLIARSDRTTTGSGTLDQDMTRRRPHQAVPASEPSPSPRLVHESHPHELRRSLESRRTLVHECETWILVESSWRI